MKLPRTVLAPRSPASGARALRPLLRCALALFAVAIGSGLAAADRTAEPRVRVTDRLGNERTVHVLSLSFDDQKVRLRGEIGGGLAIYTAELTEFEPRSRYHLVLAAAPPKDSAQHFALARRTADWRLFEPTMRHLQKALRATDSEAEPEASQARIRNWATHWLDATVREALLRGDVREAQRRLAAACTQLTGEVACKRLLDLQQAVDDAVRARHEAEERERIEKLTAEEQRLRERRRAPVLDVLTRADDELRKARVTMHRTAESRRRAATAQRLYGAAAERLERTEDDSDLLARARAGRLEAVLQHAEASTVQGDFRRALESVGEVLAHDPGHRRARQLLDTIQLANSIAGAWPFGVVVPGPAVR